MNGYSSMKIELPEHPEIARIIWPERKHIYINAAAEPGANIDHIMRGDQAFLVIAPNGDLPDGRPE